METEVVTLAFEAVISLATYFGLSPGFLAAILAVVAIAAGVGMFWLRFNPAGVVLTLFTLCLKVIRGLKRPAATAVKDDKSNASADNVSYMSNYRDNQSDTRQPSIRLPPPSLDNDPEE